jgi:predicted peroxiredoxin
MGYQEGDVLFFFGVIVLILIFAMARRSAPKRPPTSGDREPGSNRTEQQPAPPDTAASQPAPDIPVERQAGGPPRGLFLVLTSGDATAQFMALTLVDLTAVKGKSVRVLLCGAGADLACPDHSEVVVKGFNKSPKALLQELLAKGIPVEVCPPYLAQKDLREGNLIEGVKRANPPSAADALIDPGLRLFSV